MGGLELKASLGKKFERIILTNDWASWCTPVIPNYVGKHK
jgi:hypothetical protein